MRMSTKGSKETAERVFGRILDGLASRWVSIFFVFVVMAIAVSSYTQMLQGATQARSAQMLFDGPSVRSNAIALADIQRVQQAITHFDDPRHMRPTALTNLQIAVDILHVRADSFRRNIAKVPPRQEGTDALNAILNVVSIADTAFANDLADTPAFHAKLNHAIGHANTALTIFMNALYHDQQQAVAGTVSVLSGLSKLHTSYLLAMVSFAVVLQTLLRREVVNRRGKAVAENRIAFLAFHDALTGLGNHAALNDALAEHFEGDGKRTPRCSIIQLDLDGFRDINETFGAAVGDAVLKHVANAINAISKTGNATPFRLGGDEFAILVPFEDENRLLTLAKLMANAVKRPVFIDRDIFEVTVSAGIATASQVAGTGRVDGHALMRAADYTLGSARGTMGNENIRFLDQSLMAQYTNRRERMAALGDAIRSGEIDVWMQPQFDLLTLDLVGFEALARWEHEGTMIPPDEFVPMAESCGLIVALDSLMLRKATAIMAAWNQQNQSRVGVSVNLSGGHVSSDSLVMTVRDALKASGLAPDLLTLELTETVEVKDWDSVGKRLSILVDMGCYLAIDDFGSGYSSLGYLRKMPAQELKIGRSLVLDIEASKKGRSILASVVDIAQSLNFHTVVEGIETVEQALIAQKLGCNRAQGYLFSRPLKSINLPPPDELFPRDIAQLLSTNSGHLPPQAATG